MVEIDGRYKDKISKVVIGYDIDSSVYFNHKSAFYITDTNLLNLYPDFFIGKEYFAITPGEDSKSLATVEQIYSVLLENEADKNTCLVGVGGGVVTDICGFVASTYKRGISFGFLATSLMAQIDAAIGGKNGVNLNGLKNLIGTIRQPDFVICDIKYLNTLPEQELLNGICEIIKYGLIDNNNILSVLENSKDEILNINPEIFQIIVEKCVRIKTKITEQDENDSNLRKTLNFGHTVGHAIESLSGIPHGFSVCRGMLSALSISNKLGYIETGLTDRFRNLCSLYGIENSIETDKEKVISKIKNDKKRKSDIIDFILLEGIGKPKIEKIRIDKLVELL